MSKTLPTHLICACLCLLPARASAEEIQVSGVFFSLRDKADIPAPERGRITRFPVRPGDQVAADSLLAGLDDESARLNLELARLQLRKAQAEANGSQAVRMATAAADAARSELEQASANLQIANQRAQDLSAVSLAQKQLELAEDELQRAETSRQLSRISISDQEWFRLQNTCDQAKLKFAMAETASAVLQSEKSRNEQLVAQHQALVRRFVALQHQAESDHQASLIELTILEHAVRAAELQVQRLQIRAPFAGIVVETNRQPGEWIEAGEKLLQIINLETLYVEGFLTAASARTVTAGDAARVKSADSTQSFPARIVFVSPQVDSEDLIRIRAEIANPKQQFRPGSRAEMWVLPGSPANETADER